jgi:hypothetical protein
MKQSQLTFFTGVFIFCVMTMLCGIAQGTQVTMQREGAVQNVQKSTAINEDLNIDGNNLTFIPERQKDTKASGTEATKGSGSANIQRYKPYKNGEGEKK